MAPPLPPAHKAYSMNWNTIKVLKVNCVNRLESNICEEDSVIMGAIICTHNTGAEERHN